MLLRSSRGAGFKAFKSRSTRLLHFSWFLDSKNEPDQETVAFLELLNSVSDHRELRILQHFRVSAHVFEAPRKASGRPGPTKTNFHTICVKGLRRWLKAPFRKGVSSNPTAVICSSSRRAWSRQGFYKALQSIHKVIVKIFKCFTLFFFTRFLQGFYEADL